MKIGHRQIGPEHPPYIIAELGVNHNGSVERALELTRAAKEAGADAIKLQLFRADLLMSRAAKLAAYQKVAGESDAVEMLRRLEMSIDQMEPVVRLAHELGIHAIVTCFSVELVKEAERLAWDGYKTASPDIIHKPLLDALMKTGKPLIVSTGASTLDEVQRAVGWLRPASHRLALLQCVSSYPTPAGMEELGGIAALRGIFAGPVGYSDHTAGIQTGQAAVAMGACILEKHFTYDRAAAGPDHSASLEAAGLREYAASARSARNARGFRERLRDVERKSLATDEGLSPRASMSAAVELAKPAPAWVGSPVKRVLEIEQDVRRVSRQSVTTRAGLPAGHVLRRDDLTFKRPGTGIEPFRIDEIIGRALTRGVDADTPLELGDIRL